MSAEPRTLSSRLTFFGKFVFPVIWLGGFAVATVTLFVAPGVIRGADGGTPGPGLKWAFIGGTLVGGVLIWWSCGPLKRVRMDTTSLYISNYRSEIVVPLSRVVAVTEDYGASGHPVTIQFDHQTEFGERIVFIPRARWSWLGVSHPAVGEIREAIRSAGGDEPAT